MPIPASQAAPDQQQGESGDLRQYLTFVLNDEVYGIGILHIREIIEYCNLTVVPLMPEFLSGVINLRGNVVPVVSLARRFGQQPGDIGKRTSIIIVDIDSGGDNAVEVGIIVDLINEVIELGAGDIVAAPGFGASIRADFIEGMGKLEQRLMILLDVGKVLSIDELSVVAEFAGDLSTAPAASA